MANWTLKDASTVSPTITSNRQTYSTASINYSIGAYKSGDEMETDKSKFRITTNNNVHDVSLVPVPGDLTYFYLNFNIDENNTGSERQASISITYTDDNDRSNEILFLGKQQPKPTYVTISYWCTINDKTSYGSETGWKWKYDIKFDICSGTTVNPTVLKTVSMASYSPIYSNTWVPGYQTFKDIPSNWQFMKINRSASSVTYTNNDGTVTKKGYISASPINKSSFTFNNNTSTYRNSSTNGGHQINVNRDHG